MKKHIRIYLKYFGFGEQDIIICENCTSIATDVHHLSKKGMGGSKTKDYIENLMGLCRRCHTDAHAYKISQKQLTEIHLTKLKYAT